MVALVKTIILQTMSPCWYISICDLVTGQGYPAVQVVVVLVLIFLLTFYLFFIFKNIKSRNTKICSDGKAHALLSSSIQ